MLALSFVRLESFSGTYLAAVIHPLRHLTPERLFLLSEMKGKGEMSSAATQRLVRHLESCHRLIMVDDDLRHNAAKRPSSIRALRNRQKESVQDC